MEYLMTYGWSILVIAIVMIALFSMGIFGGGATSPSVCYANSGYICQSVILHSNTLTFTSLGQATGTNWIGVNLLWIPQGQILPGNSGSTTWCPSNPANIITNTISGGISCYTVTNANGAMYTAQAVTPVFAFTASTAVGTTYAGTLWAEYQITAGGPVYSVQIAKLTPKST